MVVRVPVLPCDGALCVDAVRTRLNTSGRVEPNKRSIGATNKSVVPIILVRAGDGSARIDAFRNRENAFGRIERSEVPLGVANVSMASPPVLRIVISGNRSFFIDT